MNDVKNYTTFTNFCKAVVLPSEFGRGAILRLWGLKGGCRVDLLCRKLGGTAGEHGAALTQAVFAEVRLAFRRAKVAAEQAMAVARAELGFEGGDQHLRGGVGRLRGIVGRRAAERKADAEDAARQCAAGAAAAGESGAQAGGDPGHEGTVDALVLCQSE